MKLSIERTNNIAVVGIPGEDLDAQNAKAFKKAVTPLLEENLNFIFDLSELNFVDSSGLGAILSSLRHVNNTGRDLKLCGLSTPVRALFELVRMHRIFDIYNDRDEALLAYQTSTDVVELT